MTKVLMISIANLIGFFTFCQTSTNNSYCAKSEERFVVEEEAGVTWIKYPSLDCQFSVRYTPASTSIDSILTIRVGNETIDQFKDSERANYAEMLPFVGILEWRLLVRITEMTKYGQRRADTKKLTSTYRDLAPHLYGNYAGEYALIKTNRGLNFVDRAGQLVFDCFFENATNFIDGKAAVKLDGTWQYLSLDGKLSTILE